MQIACDFILISEKSITTCSANCVTHIPVRSCPLELLPLVVLFLATITINFSLSSFALRQSWQREGGQIM